MTEIRVDQILQESGTGPVNFETEFTLKGKALNDSAGALQMTKIVDSAVNPIDSDSYYGLMWFDSSNDRLNIYTPIGWRTFNGAAVASGGGAATFTWGGDRGIVLGGSTTSSYTGSTNVIQYYDITTSGNATDFGDLTATRWENTAVSSQTRVVTMGGMSGAGNIHNWMEYVTPSSTGNSTSFGSLPNYVYIPCQGASNGTYGLYGGGWSSTTLGGTNSDGAYGAAPFGYTDGIDYITIATTGNGTDFGNFSSGGGRSGSAADSTRAVWHLAVSGGYNNILEYVTINTPGNTTDFGDISVSRNYTQACSDLTRGLYGGGGISTPPYSTNVIDYITIQTTGNAQDFGDLTSNKQGVGASSNGTYATFAGGFLSSSANYPIDIVTIQTTGNATDHGDLVTNVYTPAAGSGNPA